MPTLSEAVLALSPDLYWRLNDSAGDAATTVVNDTFTDADGTLLASHTGETGATWTSHPSYTAGAFVRNNRVHANAAANRVYYASGDPPTADYEVEASVRCVSATGRALLLARVDTAADTMYQLRLDNGGSYSIRRRVAGVETSLTSGTGTAWQANDVRTAKLVVMGTKLFGYLDGTEILAATDTNITAEGRPGIHLNGGDASGTTGMQIDSFTTRTIREQAIADSSGNSRTGTAMGDVTLESTAILGSDTSAALGDGAPAHIVSDSYEPFVQGSDRTFLIVAKRTAGTNFDVLFGGEGDQATGAVGDHPTLEIIDSGNSNVLKFYSNIAAAFPFGRDWEVDWAAGETHMVVLTYRDANPHGAAVLYLDGVSFGAGNQTATPQYHADSGRFLVGYHGNFSQNEGLNGSASSVAIWERILTAGEIRWLAQQTDLATGGRHPRVGKSMRVADVGGLRPMIGV